MGTRRDRVQKWKLGEEVRTLAHALDRPVCSADLRLHFRKFPDRYPLYLQRLGQSLIKIARERPRRAIWPLGRVGFYSYYAPDSSPEWRDKLTRYAKVGALDHAHSENLPFYVGNLLEGIHEPVARNALAGFVEEWEPIANDPAVDDWRHIHDFRRMVDRARSGAAKRFRAVAPADLIGRSNATAILRREYRLRVDGNSRLSQHRHLVRLVWPQSRLFPPQGKGFFCRSQLLAYAGAQWPLDFDEAETAAGLTLALRYGPGSRRAHHRPGP